MRTQQEKHFYRSSSPTQRTLTRAHLDSLCTLPRLHSLLQTSRDVKTVHSGTYPLHEDAVEVPVECRNYITIYF